MPTIGDRYVNANREVREQAEHPVELWLVTEALEPRILARTDIAPHVAASPSIGPSSSALDPVSGDSPRPGATLSIAAAAPG